MPTRKTDFDPIKGEQYGACINCELGLPTKADAEAHMSETFAKRPASSNGGHSISVTNPERQVRIEREVSGYVDDLLHELIEKVDELVQNGSITEGEARAALSLQSAEFDEAWDEYIEENGQG